jgi:hypothetical protein
MTSVWVAEIFRPSTIPFEQIHVMLYSFFPSVTKDEGRPYVWRLLARDRIGIVSTCRPTAPGVREVSIKSGVTYDFVLTYRRERNVAGSYTRPNGTRRKRVAHTVTITSMPELRERLIRFAGDRGGAVGYVRLDHQRTLLIASKHATLPIVDAVGNVLVTDADKFAVLLGSGGPGTGKAYGLGAWWLPQLMEPA